MKNILFIGNSYTYYNDMPVNIFKKMCESIGYDVNVTAITKGGESLAGHATNGHETFNIIETAFEEQKFDFVILQDQSDTPAISREKYIEVIGHFSNKARQNGATPIIYATWPKKSGHPNLKKFNLTTEQMRNMLDETFDLASKTFDIPIAYTSRAFLQAEQSNDISDPYKEDRSHPSYTGSFIAALSLIKTLFNVIPTNVPFEGNLSSQEANNLKKSIESLLIK